MSKIKMIVFKEFWFVSFCAESYIYISNYFNKLKKKNNTHLIKILKNIYFHISYKNETTSC